VDVQKANVLPSFTTSQAVSTGRVILDAPEQGP